MIRHALRSLKRTPVFTAAVVLTLALGAGSVGAMFTVVYGVLLAPLPYGRPARLVSVALQTPELRRMQQSPAIYYTYTRFARRLADLGFYRTGNANIWTKDDGDAPERVTATWVTASTIRLLEVKPLLGRTFTNEETRVNAPNVAVLSESVWRTRFDGARDVIGRTLIVNSVPREIIGVMPDGFSFPTPDTRLWLPVRLDPSATVVGDFAYTGVARLADGATPEDAQRELSRILPRIAESFPRLESGAATQTWLDETKPAAVVTPLREEVTSGIARTLLILAAGAGLVLLVAWANVANLLLIRADGRQLEIAVREALGASRLRIMTHFLGESAVVGAIAGVLALLAAWGAVHALVVFQPADVPRLAELHIGPATVAFVVLVTLVGAVICTGVPAVRLRRASLSINLRDGARGDTAGKTRQRLRASIAALQIAVALVVSAGSVLLLRTFQRLYDERPGFDAEQVVTIWTQLPFARYGDSASVEFYGRLGERVGAIPSVRAAGLTTLVPLGAGERREQSFFVAGAGREVSLPVTVVDGGYFSTLKIPVVVGRVFESPGVQRHGDVVISQRAAAAIWKDSTGTAALGRQLSLVPSGPTYTVVGVVGDVRDQDLATAPSPAIYMPQVVPVSPTEPRARRTMALVVRTAAAPAAVVGAVRVVVRDLDPTVPIFNVETMSDVVRESTARLSLTLALVTAAAAITLLLGTIGLYGVMAYMVALRTREFGVRLALGAPPRQVARTVAARGLVVVAGGAAGGFVFYAMAAPFLRAFLYGVTPTDPLTLATVTIVLVATASLASWLPARRAARVDPAVALRAE